jgi:oligoribonuclease NrnB/cAMP/cGMP phosphodiesterase (DHH superfamily)
MNLIVSHAKCPDGLAAAWVFWKEGYKNFKFVNHQDYDELPECKGMTVFFTDFSYTQKEMLQIAQEAEKLVLLDHHKTTIPTAEELKKRGHEVHMDLDRSGAQIAWDYLHPDKPRPWWIDDIAERDLWRWGIENSRDTTTALFRGRYYTDFESLDRIDEHPRDYYVQKGKIIREFEDENAKLIARNSVFVLGDGIPMRLVECPRHYRSDVCNQLLEDEKIKAAVAFSYQFDRNEWWLSFRSRKKNGKAEFDVSSFAKKHFKGAGGHPCAAGAKTSKSLHTHFKKPKNPI